ncbi:MAG: DUF1501 domain-containing protein, partial [Myxococcales bacterium]|nr:DUF1501 domain-containing protein [Myxococcales bacterium]
APHPQKRTVLVVVLLRGAADGLSVVVPHGDREYYDLRRQIAIAPPGKAQSAIDLDGRFGLHPRLAPLKAAWDAGELAPIVSFGSPDPTRSHFDAQDRMELGTPRVAGKPGAHYQSGFMNRMAGALGLSDPLGAVALAANMPMILRGTAPALSLEGIEDFGLDAPAQAKSRLEAGFERLYAKAQRRSPRIGDAGQVGLKALKELRDVPARASSARYPQGALGSNLRDLARLVHGSPALRLGFIEVGGWDTHTGQGGAAGGRLARSLDELGKGLAAFREDLGDEGARVVTLVMTEFGRTAAQNGSGGTDHGHGSVALLLGGPVRGKRVLGQFPGLKSDQLYQGRDVAVTTDFRDVVAEIAQRHLSVKPSAVFPGYTPGAGVGALA